MRNIFRLAVALMLTMNLPAVWSAGDGNDWGFENRSSWTGGVLDTQIKKSGKSSLLLESNQSANATFKISKGNYYLNGYVKGENLSGDAYVELKSKGVNGRTLPVAKGKFDWKPILGLLYIESDTTCQIKVSLMGKGKVWFDDLSMEKMPEPQGISNGDKDGPYKHFVVLATSKDCKNWAADWNILIRHASVPHIAYFNGLYWVYYVNGLVHRLYAGYGKDPRKLTLEAVKIDGSECGDCVDPDALVVDDKLRLFYLGNFRTGGNTILSATTTDGINFTKDKGERYKNTSGGFITDPDVVNIGSKWFMYISKGETNIGLESADGMSFSKPFEAGKGAVSDTVAVDGGYRQFYHGKGGIASRFTTDGRNFSDEGIRLKPPMGYFMGDPNVAKIGDTWFMYVKIALAGDMPGNQNPPGGDQMDYPPGMEKGKVFGKADESSYLKVNADSGFKPARGGLAQNPGPARYRLMTATSKDGQKFERTNKIICDQGAVPDMVVDKNGCIYLYYTAWTVGSQINKTSVAISKDKGQSWSFHYLNLDRRAGESDLVDPDVLILEDGTFRLYTTVNYDRYARTVYHDSKDGINFTRKGIAFDPGAQILDPSTIKIGDTYHIYGGGKTPTDNWHGTSKDGASYKFVGMVRAEKDKSPQMMANGFKDGDRYRFFGFGNDRKGGISSFTSTDGVKWVAETSWRLEADPKSKLEFAPPPPHDPAIVKLPDGTYLMVYVALIKY